MACIKETPKWVIPALLLAVLTLSVEGCAASARGKYAQANDTFIATVEILLSARSAGVFTAEEWANDIAPLISLADSLLDAYDEASKVGDGKVGRAYLDQFEKVLQYLKPFIIRAHERS